MIPSKITVLIDSRERHPLLFPKWITVFPDRSCDVVHIEVETEMVTMPAGDYTLKGYDSVCIGETKRSLRELYNNVCTKDWDREVRALKRLSESCKYPLLIWEMTPSELFRPTSFVPDPQLVFDRWMQVVVRFNLRLMLAGVGRGPGPRRTLGEQMVRLMLAYIENPSPPERQQWDDDLRKKMWEWAPTWYTNSEKTDELHPKAE